MKSTTDTRQALESRHEADALVPVLADLAALRAAVSATDAKVDGARSQVATVDALVKALSARFDALDAAVAHLHTDVSDMRVVVDRIDANTTTRTP